LYSEIVCIFNHSPYGQCLYLPGRCPWGTTNPIRKSPERAASNSVVRYGLKTLFQSKLSLFSCNQQKFIIMPQSLAQVYVHIVFLTKHGNRYIDEELRLKLQSYIIGILKNLGSYTHEIYANPDHIHILSTLPRTITMAQMVNKIKSNSSRWVKTEGSKYFRWQDGYGIFSVSPSKLESVKKYIQHQSDHHDTISFKEEMRRFFEEYEIEYDERYVWD